jgi:signal recognition particle subunit SRP54
MGDIVSLVEKAAENIDAEQAAAMAKKMQSGKFDLDDLAAQIGQMQKLGGMGGVMGMMPGMAKMKDQIAAAGMDDKLLKRQLAIISSMTKWERANPDQLKHSRKKRIAAGSGTDAADINKLLKMHRQMADMMKAMGGKGGKGAGIMGKLMGGLGAKMGLPGGMGGGMPDLSKMDPKQLEEMAKAMQKGGLGSLPGGLPPGLGSGGLPGLPGGGFPGLPGLGRKK